MPPDVRELERKARVAEIHGQEACSVGVKEPIASGASVRDPLFSDSKSHITESEISCDT